jgi:hypothetical protein
MIGRTIIGLGGDDGDDGRSPLSLGSRIGQSISVLGGGDDGDDRYRSTILSVGDDLRSEISLNWTNVDRS